jgi:predicted RNA-binding Zn ribbon-like protein
MSSEFEFVGGSICLDLANARHTLCDADPADRYAALLRWARAAGFLSEHDARALRRSAKRHPLAATAVFKRAVRLAEAIERIFSAVAKSARPAEQDLDLLNTEVADALCSRRLVAGNAGFEWHWSGREAKLERVLWPVAQSAAELLVSDELARVKTCDNHTCAWLFLDRSKNGRRRWCDMAVCGNRAKARRYRDRHRTAS